MKKLLSILFIGIPYICSAFTIEKIEFEGHEYLYDYPDLKSLIHSPNCKCEKRRRDGLNLMLELIIRKSIEEKENVQ